MTPKIINNHIQDMDRQYPLETPFQLKVLLLEWLKTSGSTIGDLYGKSSDQRPLLWVKKDNIIYKIGADTKRIGVEAFLKNEENKNPWVIIPTERSGDLRKATNDINRESMPGFYMYKV